jgi:hypothetical protein
METVSRNVSAVARSQGWRWVCYLLIAEAFLLILMIGSAGLAAAWFMFSDTTPLPISIECEGSFENLGSAKFSRRSEFAQEKNIPEADQPGMFDTG